MTKTWINLCDMHETLNCLNRLDLATLNCVKRLESKIEKFITILWWNDRIQNIMIWKESDNVWLDRVVMEHKTRLDGRGNWGLGRNVATNYFTCTQWSASSVSSHQIRLSASAVGLISRRSPLKNSRGNSPQIVQNWARRVGFGFTCTNKAQQCFYPFHVSLSDQNSPELRSKTI